MFHINPIIIMSVLICIILILSTLYIVSNRRKNIKENKDRPSKKNKLIIILLIILTLILIGVTVNYISNKTLYQIELELRDEFDNVKGIDISGYGPHCYINIYIDEEESEFEDIEPIFISMMKKVHEKDNYNYIKEKQSKNINEELVFLHICFYTSKKREAESVFEFSSFKDFKEWKADGDSTKKYTLSDYLDN